ncbi:50S ribosomal protein L11 methyltransferase [Youxingia wuxianensis]|uniref:Ribosomal protein L11 methyltransferase n=1 Tax=Youxingia wuxianensis TaxID=2763678 RepID=A0A926IGA0_9FIRM|nr:50S ribosomal protein L11 methyltransferase [Youxingia wuxianensis]MBC8584011.1 50S ribosomal protein L11 methyltransferase [Youxingia wuxianensis]
MQYSEVRVKIPAKRVETASAIANMVVPYGIYIEDYSDIEQQVPQIAHVDLIEQELLDRDRETAVIHVYISPQESPLEAISFLEERLNKEQIPYEIETDKIEEEDWATAWKKYYNPTKVSDRLVVCPSWEEYTPEQEEVVLLMDPGMAFGTGTHDTTRLCMQLLEQYVDKDTNLLDIGTGSGILAVAALLLGAKSAVGCDIDQVAVKVAEENARLNQVEERATFHCGDLTQKVTGKFHVISANIVADVIIRLVPQLDGLLEKGGTFIASGIIDTREMDVIDALAGAGYILDERRQSGGWVALAVKRIADAPQDLL